MKNENKLKLRIGNDFTDRNTEQVSCCSHVSFLSFSRARFPLPGSPYTRRLKTGINFYNNYSVMKKSWLLSKQKETKWL